MRVKILSWNIWMGKYLPKIIDLIASERPNIVCLQEVIQLPEGIENTAEIIAKKLGYQWKFAAVTKFPSDDGPVDWGEAVLSTYDIVKSEVLELSKDPRHIGLQADIRVGDDMLHVISTHLTHTHQAPSEHQEQEAASLVRLSPKAHTLIMGDFNALPTSKTIGIMRKALRDADPINMPTWCVYPDGCATCQLAKVTKRLDYVFATPDFAVSDYRVIPSDGSDHLPVTATITVK